MIIFSNELENTTNLIKNINKYKEFSNFYVIPRGSDGKLINGSYNRVWKEEKYIDMNVKFI